MLLTSFKFTNKTSWVATVFFIAKSRHKFLSMESQFQQLIYGTSWTKRCSERPTAPAPECDNIPSVSSHDLTPGNKRWFHSKTETDQSLLFLVIFSLSVCILQYRSNLSKYTNVNTFCSSLSVNNTSRWPRQLKQKKPFFSDLKEQNSHSSVHGNKEYIL